MGRAANPICRQSSLSDVSFETTGMREHVEVASFRIMKPLCRGYKAQTGLTSLKPYNIARERHRAGERLCLLLVHVYLYFLVRVFLESCQVQRHTPLKIHVIEYERK